jgi:hypothetical protein
LRGEKGKFRGEIYFGGRGSGYTYPGKFSGDSNDI